MSKYPKMLYTRDFHTFHDGDQNKVHDFELAKKKGLMTVVVASPEEEAKKVSEGYREHWDPKLWEDEKKSAPAQKQRVVTE